VTEAEWLSSKTPMKLLEHVQGNGDATVRKLRLLTVACCRRVERWFLGDNQKEALNSLERHADEVATSNDLSVIQHASNVGYLPENPVGLEIDHLEAVSSAASVLCEALRYDRLLSARSAYRLPLYETIRYTGETAAAAAITFGKQGSRALPAELAEHEAIALVVHDIFGNPFRPVTLNPSWLTSTVLALANGIYTEKAFDRMPILADALQDAGCDNEDILNHCRQVGEHVRGCFVVDLLTGRK
jgi:hypothetical protein